MAYLTIRIKGVESYSRQALDKDRIVLGRASAADLPIKHSSISREHCAFVRQGETWLVEDLGSANGTMVNKVKITERTALNERDIVAAGHARLTFHAAAMPAVEAAVDLNLNEAGEDAGGPTRRRGENDPAEATACASCGGWFSIAHRMAGDRMECPRCRHDNLVPALSS